MNQVRIVLLLVLAVGNSMLTARISRAVVPQADVERLEQTFTRALTEQGEEQIAPGSRKTGRPFKPSGELVRLQSS